MEPCPFRVFPASSLPHRPVGRRCDFPRSSVPSTASLGLAPREASRSVSLRFRSRVFSTPQRFPSNPEFRGLVSCRSQFLGSSLQSLPLAKIARPSRGRLAPLPLSTDAPNRAACALSPPVSPTPAPLAQWPGSPSNYGLPFHEPKLASRSSWAHAAEPIRSADFTDFEASLPLRIRSRPARVAPTWRSMLSWGSSPLRSSPSTPRVLNPPQASRAHDTLLRPKASQQRPSRPAASRAG